MGRKTKDLTNQIFGKLTVEKWLPYKSYGQTAWECRCECGNSCVKRYCDLVTKKPRKLPHSCGCLKHPKNPKRHQKDYKLACKLNPRVPQTAFEALYSKYKTSAKTRNLEFTLSFQEFTDIVSKNCHYCNAPPSQSRKSGRMNTDCCVYSGIDRVDNTKGYVQGNCEPSCKQCNYAKRTLSIAEFDNWIRRIYLFRHNT